MFSSTHTCTQSGALYLLCVPSGYLLLVIYSLCNLHVVSSPPPPRPPSSHTYIHRHRCTCMSYTVAFHLYTPVHSRECCTRCVCPMATCCWSSTRCAPPPSHTHTYTYIHRHRYKCINHTMYVFIYVHLYTVGSAVPAMCALRLPAAGHLLAVQPARGVLGHQGGAQEEDQGRAGAGEGGSREEGPGEGQEEGLLQQVSGWSVCLFTCFTTSLECLFVCFTISLECLFASPSHWSVCLLHHLVGVFVSPTHWSVCLFASATH